MHIPSTILVALPRLRANIVHFLLVVYSFLLESRFVGRFLLGRRNAAPLHQGGGGGSSSPTTGGGHHLHRGGRGDNIVLKSRQQELTTSSHGSRPPNVIHHSTTVSTQENKSSNAPQPSSGVPTATAAAGGGGVMLDSKGGFNGVGMYRRPPTISTSSCMPNSSSQLPPESSSRSAAGSIARGGGGGGGVTLVSRGLNDYPAERSSGTSNTQRRHHHLLGNSGATRSVDILSKPPVQQLLRHRRCSSMYGSDDNMEQSRLFDCLIKAIRRHEQDSVRNLLSGMTPEAKLSVLKRTDPQQGLTPIHFAVQERLYDVVNELVSSVDSQEARKQLVSSSGSTVNSYAPIHIAAIRGDCEIICLLLRHGASPNATSKLAATPLHLAASKGHTAACRLLLESGSDVNAATKTGNTALMSAVHNKNMEMVELLVTYGANPKITTQSGLNALGLALSLNATEILLVLERSVRKHGHRRTPSKSLL